MKCDDIQQCLLDETLPLFEGLTEHVAACPRCLPFSQSLSAARQLRGVVPALVRRVPVAKVKRRLQLTAALTLIATGLLTQARLAHDWVVQRPHVPTVAAAEYEHSPIPVMANPRDEAQAWRALAMLARDGETEARRNPRVDDPSLERFGALSSWVAPHPTSPVRSLELGAFSSPLITTSED